MTAAHIRQGITCVFNDGGMYPGITNLPHISLAKCTVIEWGTQGVSTGTWSREETDVLREERQLAPLRDTPISSIDVHNLRALIHG